MGPYELARAMLSKLDFQGSRYTMDGDSRVGKVIIIQQRAYGCFRALMDLSIWQRLREECGGHFAKLSLDTLLEDPRFVPISSG